MGVDSIDPVEPPPQGDIEFVDMETRTPDIIEEKVRRAILEGGKERTVLFPSATPHERHSQKFLANAVRYIEAGLKYGAM